MCDVENVATYGKLKLFCCKISFVAIYALCRGKVLFKSTHFCVEKNLSKSFLSGEKLQISGLVFPDFAGFSDFAVFL